MHLVIAPPTGGIETQRMVKSGNYESGANYSLKQVTGWVADEATLATVVASRLIVKGAGDVTITAVLDSNTNDAAKPDVVKVTHNDTIVATGDLSAYNDRRTVTITANVTIADGDTVWLQTITGSAIAARIYAGSTIEVAST
ncbi:hypothetical protein L5I01_17580 [Gordonia sp. HY442]|uniref:hypothetical protein n=1 Tax=Gordonia zhenghanii TaxID=2911516 RepID=UPI001F23393C|nr:hypothetical protein [Gordonia zhenghanii]MCF8605168.1 hypothetical protein [Gordonia zhenghanii]